MGSGRSGQELDAVRIAGLIVEARAGSRQAYDEIMVFSRQYLLLIANEELPHELQAKEGASDLVQKTQLEAFKGFGSFRGHTPAELLGWLREILRNNVRELDTHYNGVSKRQADREVPICSPDTGPGLAEQLAADQSSPSSHLQREERDKLVEDALQQLPEDYRNVVIWRNRDGLSFEEISERLDRSVDAARKVWSRAIKQLQDRLQGPHEPS